MDLALALPTHRVDRPAEFVSAEAVAQMASAAEEAGFDAVYVTEHPMPGAAWMASGGHHALDPFVALSFVAAATTRLRLATLLCVLAYRNPFLTAKSAASLDALSGGRLVLGVAAGYLAEEFAALGVDLAERNELTDEALVAMKQAWTGQPVALRGRHFSAPDNLMLPRPTQRPHPPIWIGGNSRRAIRRAVEFADGWAPMPNPDALAARRRSAVLETLEDLRDRIGYARDQARRLGRVAPMTIACSLGGLALATVGRGDDLLVETAQQLAGVGVNYLYLGLPGAATRDAYLAETGRLGAEVLPRLDAIEAGSGIGTPPRPAAAEGPGPVG